MNIKMENNILLCCIEDKLDDMISMLSNIDNTIILESKILDQCMSKACYYGHLNIVNYLLEKGCTEYYWGLVSSIESGNKEIFDKLINIIGTIDLQKEKIYKLLTKSVWYRNMYMYKKLIEHGAIPSYDTYCYAVMSNNLDVINDIVNICQDIINPNYMPKRIIKNNWIDLILRLIELGANKFDDPFIIASSYNNEYLMKLFLDKGLENYEKCFISTICYDNLYGCKLLLDKIKMLDIKIDYNKGLITNLYNKFAYEQYTQCNDLDENYVNHNKLIKKLLLKNGANLNDCIVYKEYLQYEDSHEEELFIEYLRNIMNIKK